MGLFLSFVKAFLYVFSRLGVPLFLMITGALLLDRKYEEKNQLRRFITHNYAVASHNDDMAGDHVCFSAVF